MEATRPALASRGRVKDKSKFKQGLLGLVSHLDRQNLAMRADQYPLRQLGERPGGLFPSSLNAGHH